MRIVGVWGFVVAIACSSSEPELSEDMCALAEIERLDLEIGREACACDWAEQGFDSELECRADYDAYFASPVLQFHFSCLCEGAAALDADGRRSIDCLRSVVDAASNCLGRSGCDLEARDACAEAEDAATASCGELSSGHADLLLDLYDGCFERDVVGPPGTCPDGTIEEVASSTTILRGNDSQASCGGEGADVAFEWSALEGGTYRVTLTPADAIHETVLYVLDGCAGVELGCDAPIDSGLAANVELSVTAGETLIIVADGDEADDAGEFEIRITRVD